MEQQPQIELESEEMEQPDRFASEYRASLQSRDYGDVRVFPDIESLKRIGDYWADELKNPERSERSKNEINKIIGRVAFEIHSREYPERVMIAEISSEIDAIFAEVNTEAAIQASFDQEQQAA